MAGSAPSWLRFSNVPRAISRFVLRLTGSTAPAIKKKTEMELSA